MKRRFTRLFRILFCLTLVAGLTWKLLPREPLLLDRAQKITAFSPGDQNYCWLSDYELLIENNPSDGTAHLTLRDLRAGQKTVPAGLNRAYKANSNNEGIYPSPDGQWIMLIPFDSEPNLRLIRRDGKEIPCNVEGNTHIAWLSNSQAWIEVLNQREINPNGENDSQDEMSRWARIHSLQQPDQFRKLPISPPFKMEFANSLRVCGDTLFVLRFSAEDVTLEDIVAYHIGAAELKQIAVYPMRGKQETETAIDTPATGPVRTYPSPAANADITECTLSPDGTRLAWLVTHEYHNPLLAWLHRFLSAVPVPSATHVELWTGDLHGSHKREIGHIDPTGDTDRAANGLEWLPDGKRLSFMREHSLYTVPVDNSAP